VGNKFRLGRKIGSGSFGDIYLGKLVGRMHENVLNSMGCVCVYEHRPDWVLCACMWPFCLCLGRTRTHTRFIDVVGSTHMHAV
jgi:hypothetical protein